MRTPVPSTLAALAILLGPTACTGEPDDEPEGPRAQVGDVVPHGLASQVEGQHAYVVVPGRRYDFLVSSPRAELDSVSAADAGVATVPAEGAAVVEVAWSLGPADGDWFAAVADDDPEIALAVVADGTTYEVGDVDREGPTAAYVVVPDTTDEVSVQLSYDGLTQVVQVVGADPVDQPTDAPPGLYGGPPRLEPGVEVRGRADAGGARLTGGEVRTQALSPTPYTSALGWAPQGRSWVVVDVAVSGLLASLEVAGEDVGYTVDGGEVVVRLDGARPEELLPYGSPRPEDDTVGEQDPGATGLDDAWRAQAVFSVPDTFTGGRLTVRRPLDLRPEDVEEARRLGAPQRLGTTLTAGRTLAS